MAKYRWSRRISTTEIFSRMGIFGSRDRVTESSRCSQVLTKWVKNGHALGEDRANLAMTMVPACYVMKRLAFILRKEAEAI